MVTPAQIADSHAIIDRYAGAVANESDLCDYLSPLFAGSEEEQEKFKTLFDQHYEENTTTDPPGGEGWKLPAQVKDHWWKYLLAAAILIAGVIWLKKRTDEIPLRNLFFDEQLTGKPQGFFDAFTVKTGETLEVYPKPTIATWIVAISLNLLPLRLGDLLIGYFRKAPVYQEGDLSTEGLRRCILRNTVKV